MDQKTKQLILQETIKTLHTAALQIEIEVDGRDFELYCDHEGWNTLMSAVTYLREQTEDQSERSGPETRGFEHASDEACDGHIGPDGLCSVCSVYRGDPCMHCGGRSFHKPDCPNLEPGDDDYRVFAAQTFAPVARRGETVEEPAIYRVRLVDLHVDVMKPEDAVLEIAGFSSSAEYPSVMDIAAALASDKVFRSKQCVYAMDLDEALGAALIPVALVLDPFTTRIMDFLMNPARKGGRA